MFGFCMGARVCVFLRLWFFFSREAEKRNMQEKVAELASMPKEKKKTQKKAKRLTSSYDLSKLSVHIQCVYPFYVVHLKISLLGK